MEWVDASLEFPDVGKLCVVYNGKEFGLSKVFDEGKGKVWEGGYSPTYWFLVPEPPLDGGSMKEFKSIYRDSSKLYRYL